MIDHRNRETRRAHPHDRGSDRDRAPQPPVDRLAARGRAPTPPTSRQALRRALRQDPDVILIGEIRDEETMRTALAAAETGHLVLATLHTINAQETIARVLDLFPPRPSSRRVRCSRARSRASSRSGCAKTIDGRRTAVVEVLVDTRRASRTASATRRRPPSSPEAIADGEYYGMQTFDQALIKLIMAGRISEDEALPPHDEPAELPPHARQHARAGNRGHRTGSPRGGGTPARRTARRRGRRATRGGAGGTRICHGG